MNERLNISERVLESKLVQLREILDAIHHWTIRTASGHDHRDPRALETVIEHLCIRGVDIVRALSEHAGGTEISLLTSSLESGEGDDDEGDDDTHAAAPLAAAEAKDAFTLRTMTVAELRAAEDLPDDASVLVRLDAPSAAMAAEAGQ